MKGAQQPFNGNFQDPESGQRACESGFRRPPRRFRSFRWATARPCEGSIELDLVSVGRELDIFQWRLRHATGAEKAADVADISTDHTRLYIEKKDSGSSNEGFYSVACASFLHVTNGRRCGSSDLCGASGCARKRVWTTFPVKRSRGSLSRAGNREDAVCFADFDRHTSTMFPARGERKRGQRRRA